jgi:hypothetical protein
MSRYVETEQNEEKELCFLVNNFNGGRFILTESFALSSFKLSICYMYYINPR